MNYITHLTGFFQKISADYQLNPTHISLYMALFQQWNLNRFRNPISIARTEVMSISKISSRVTYHKCIKELHSRGYIHYDPSYNHFRGSLVYMLRFGEERAPEKRDSLNQHKIQTGAVPEVDGNCIRSERELSPSINDKNVRNSLNGSQNTLTWGADKESERKGKEKSCAEKEKGLPPSQEEVQAFFDAAGQSELEALRFFHYYSATGWVMGHAPIQDWRAAARKWMLQDLIPYFYGSSQPKPAPLPDERNYDEPL